MKSAPARNAPTRQHHWWCARTTTNAAHRARDASGRDSRRCSPTALASTSAPRAVAPRSFARATHLRVARCRAHVRRSRANAVDRRVSLARAATADASASPSTIADDGEDDQLAGDIEIPERPTHVRAVDGFLPAADAASLRKVFDDHHDDPKPHARVPIRVGLLARPRAVHPAAHPRGGLLPRGPVPRSSSPPSSPSPASELGCAGMPTVLAQLLRGRRPTGVPRRRPARSVWAFVLSLTDWKARKFTGGETLILKPETLDYWRGFDAGAVVERESLARLVEPNSTASSCSILGYRTACRWWRACATRARGDW